MVVTNGLAPNLQGLSMERLGLGVVAYRFVKPRQVVQADGKIRMVLTKGLALNLQGLSMERLGLGVVAYRSV